MSDLLLAVKLGPNGPSLNPQCLPAAIRRIGPFTGLAVCFNTASTDLEALVRVSRAAAIHALSTSDNAYRVVEVGSWCGESALAILAGYHDLLHGGPQTLWAPPGFQMQLTCVDHFQGSPTDCSSETAVKYGGDVEVWLRDALWQGKMVFGDQLDAQVLRMTSEQAAHVLSSQRHPLHMVFLDAGHDYASISQDLELWYPLLGDGGFLVGHDYGAKFPDVITAVDSFAQNTLGGACLYIPDTEIWLLRKPRVFDNLQC